MASPATAAFLAAYNSHSAQPCFLVEIDLTFPSSRTLRLTDAPEPIEVGTETFVPFVSDVDAIRAPGDFGGPGLQPATTAITIANVRMPHQADGKVFANLLTEYRFHGAAIRVYLWERSLTNPVDRLCVFNKGVVRRYRANRETVTLEATQSPSWVRQVPPKSANRTDYPALLDAFDGAPLAIVYGDHSAQGMRGPFGGGYGTGSPTPKMVQEDAGGGLFALPGVVVDPGNSASGSKARILFAGHDVKAIKGASSGRSAFIVAEDRLATLDDTALSIVNTGQHAGLDLALGSLKAYVGLMPTDIRVSGGTENNTAKDPMSALQPLDEVSFAFLDQAAGYHVLSAIVPDFSPLGTMIELRYEILYATASGNLVVYLNAGTALGLPSTGSLQLPGQAQGAVNAAAYSKDWRIATGVAGATQELILKFSAGANQTARIHLAALVAVYRPNLNLIVAQSVNQDLRRRLLTEAIRRGGVLGRGSATDYAVARRIREATTSPAQYGLSASMYANLLGQADDGSGTYTGVASELIQRAPDIMRHFLTTYGAVSAGDIESGSTAFGSFVAARDSLRTRVGSEFIFAVRIADRMSTEDALQSMAAQSLSCVFMDRFDGKFKIVPWTRYKAVDVDRKFYAEDVIDLEVEHEQDLEASPGVRVQYAYDHFRGKFMGDSSLGSGRSSSGLVEIGARDQAQVVTTGVNDKVDFDDGASRTVTLASSSYTPAGAAKELRAKLNSVGTTDKRAGWGFAIEASENDRLDFNDGAARTASFTAAVYETVEEWIAEIVRGIQATGSTALTGITYNSSFGTFTFTWGSAVTLNGNTGANKARTILPWLGFNIHADSASATSHVSAVARWKDRYFVCRENTGTALTLKCATGANAATSALRLFGFETLGLDISTATQPFAHYPRGGREAEATTALAYTAEERPTIQLPWVRETAVAVDVRDRAFDLFHRAPPIVVRFRTKRAPDLQRMRVVEFDADLDPIWRYPGGSWAGRRFWVVEVQQNGRPSLDQEIVLVEQ